MLTASACASSRQASTVPEACLPSGRLDFLVPCSLSLAPARLPACLPAHLQGDACALPQQLGPVDAVLAANLLCRLPDPLRFLGRLPSLVNRGGVVVLVSPYSWLAAWTPHEKWIGGYTDKASGGWWWRCWFSRVCVELRVCRGYGTMQIGSFHVVQGGKPVWSAEALKQVLSGADLSGSVGGLAAGIGCMNCTPSHTSSLPAAANVCHSLCSQLHSS